MHNKKVTGKSRRKILLTKMQWEENNVSQRNYKLFAIKLTVSVLKKYNCFVSGCKNSEI